MSTVLQQVEGGAALAPWEKQLDLVKRTIGAEDLSDDEFDLFLYQARRTGLDPLARQIYGIPYRVNKGTQNAPDWQTKLTIVTGIDGYRLTAERTGLYAGSDDVVYGGEVSDKTVLTRRDGTAYKTIEYVRPETATATVYKIVGGVRCPFTATARWVEYFPASKPGKWPEMPYLMLGKCAEALAIRKAFPADIQGLYIQEETDRLRAEQGGDEDVLTIDPETGKIIENPLETSAKGEPAEPAKPSGASAAARTAKTANPTASKKEQENAAAVAVQAPPEEHKPNHRAAYWAIHGHLKLPPHEGELKKLNYEVWWKMLGKVYEGGSQIPEEGWAKLRRYTERIQATAEGTCQEKQFQALAMPPVWKNYLDAKAAQEASPNADEYDPFADEVEGVGQKAASA